MKKLLSVIVLLIIFTTGLSAQTTYTLPTATVAGKSGGVISKDTLINAGKLECSDPGFVIKSFTLTIEVPPDLVSITSKTPEFTEIMKGYLAGAKAGQKIFFEDIKATNAEGKTYNLAVMSFKLQ